MPRSEQINELVTALAKAQAMMQNPAKNRSVTIKTDKGQYVFDYADLGAVVDAIKIPLASNGLSFSHLIEDDRGGMLLTTTLFHNSGQWLSSIYPLPRNGEPKSFGAAVTYGKRYTLAALVGLASDEDKDAEPDLEVAPEPRDQERGGSRKQQSNQRTGGAARVAPVQAAPSGGDAGPNRSSPTSTATGSPAEGSGQQQPKKSLTPRQSSAAEAMKRNSWRPSELVAYMKAAFRVDSVDALEEGPFQSLLDVITSLTFQDATNELKLRAPAEAPRPEKKAEPVPETGPSPIAKEILAKHCLQESLAIADAEAPLEPGAGG